MKILSSAEQLRNALIQIKPSKIAVAYVGAGWKEYVSLEHLEEIILSPTLGSNPKAIDKIMKTIGAENVYFLDNLHSKLYLGEKSALLGSSNLSKNGFADSGKFEAGVVLTESSSLKQLDDIFKGYKEQAIKDYPTPESKIEKLKQLMGLWQAAIGHGVNTACNEESPSIGAYEPSQLDRIHIAWYIPGDLDFNNEAIATVVPTIVTEPNGIDLNNYFSNWANFCEEDSINEGDWILLWRSTNYGYPDGRASLGWMYIHHIIPNGVYNSPWTKLACESLTLQSVPEPFILDDPLTKSIIKEAIKLDQFHKLRWSSEDGYNEWRLAPADELVPEFLEYIKEQYLREK